MIQSVRFVAVIYLIFSVSATPDFSFDNFDPADFFTRGTQPITVSFDITLTEDFPSQTGAAFYNTTQQNLGNGFTTQFRFLSKYCDDSNYVNPTGFAFVISALDPMNQPGEAFGGGLGAANYSKAIIVGYSAIPNGDGYLSLCGANATSLGGADLFTSDKCLTINWPAVENVLCQGESFYEIEFIPPSTWKMTIAGETLPPLTLDPTPFIGNVSDPLYLGFTATTVDNGYMFQSLNTWSLQTNPDPVSEGVIPILECFENNNGSYVAYFGYNNTFNASVSASGDNNQLSIGGAIQPVVFSPGRSSFLFSSSWSGSKVTWTLTNHVLSFDSSETGHICPSMINVKILFTTPQELSTNDTLALIDSIATYAIISSERLHVIGTTYDMQAKKRQVDNNDLIADLEVEISQANSTESGEPTPAQVVTSLVQLTNNNGAANIVLNPNGDEGRSLVTVETVPTGAELPGKVIDASVPLTAQQPSPSTTTPSLTTSPQGTTPVVSHSSSLILTITHLLFILMVAVSF